MILYRLIMATIKTEQLTERETEVLCQVSKGRLNKEIGAELNISLDTVKKHIKNIYRKVNARNRIEAVHYAMRIESGMAVQTTVTENLPE